MSANRVTKNGRGRLVLVHGAAAVDVRDVTREGIRAALRSSERAPRAIETVENEERGWDDFCARIGWQSGAPVTVDDLEARLVAMESASTMLAGIERRASAIPGDGADVARAASAELEPEIGAAHVRRGPSLRRRVAATSALVLAAAAATFLVTWSTTRRPSELPAASAAATDFQASGARPAVSDDGLQEKPVEKDTRCPLDPPRAQPPESPKVDPSAKPAEPAEPPGSMIARTDPRPMRRASYTAPQGRAPKPREATVVARRASGADTYTAPLEPARRPSVLAPSPTVADLGVAGLRAVSFSVGERSTEAVGGAWSLGASSKVFGVSFVGSSTPTSLSAFAAPTIGAIGQLDLAKAFGSKL